MLEVSNERPHATLGGSSAHRWLNCPGSIFLLQKVPRKPASDAALLGTDAHGALEKLLGAFLEHKIKGTPWPIVIEVDISIQDFAHQTVTEVWEKVLFESVTGKQYGIETKLVLSELLDMFGYVDFWCVYIDDKGKKAGVIFDYKHGFHSVKVEKNAQLAYYAVALQETLRIYGKELDYIRGVIYQPRVFGEEAYKETKFSAKQLDAWKQKFLKVGKEIIEEKKPTFKAGEWCQFCDAQAICPTYKNNLSQNTSLRLLEETSLVPTFEFPDVTTISDDELRKIALHGDKITTFINSVKSHVIQRNLSGAPLPGTKLIHSKTRRKWKDNEEEIIKDLWDAGAHNVSRLKLMGINQVETELTSVMGKAQAKKFLEGYTTLTEPSIKLVSDEDEGQEIQNSQNLLNDKEI